METKKERLILGACLCTVGYFFFAVMGACSKIAIHQLSATTILFVQNIVALLLLLPEICVKGWKTLKTDRIGMHLVRDIGGVLSFLTLFLALRDIPLVDGMLLLYSAPLWIPLIALVWLRSRVRKDLWWGMIIGFIGIILILKPGEGLANISSFWGVSAGILFGISLLALRQLASTEPTHRTLFYFFLVSIIVTAPFYFFEKGMLSRREIELLVSSGASLFVGSWLLAYSLRHGKASTLGPIAYTGVVYSGILGWLIWGHIPDVLSFIGMILVITGGILSIYFEKKNVKI